MTTNTCPKCGNEYKQIGNHWQHNESHIHSLSQIQHEIIKGLVLGDGFVDDRSRNCFLVVGSTNREFLVWLQDQFPIISRGVRLEKTSEELVQRNKQSQWVSVGDDPDYNDIYRWNTVTHPDINTYQGGLETVSELRPESLKVYYVSDGTLAVAGNNYRPQFRVVDSERRDQISDLIRCCGFTVTSTEGNIYIKQSQTQDFLDYIGTPIPGFEYKWEN